MIMSGVISDRRISARVKGNVYKVAVRPAMLYGLETVALTKREEAEMEVTGLKMLRFSLDVPRMDKISNEDSDVRGTAQVGRVGEKTRETGLRWFGRVRRKVDGYIGRWVLRMELLGKRKEERGRSKMRFIDAVGYNMVVAEVRDDDAEDTTEYRLKICCGET